MSQVDTSDSWLRTLTNPNKVAPLHPWATYKLDLWMNAVHEKIYIIIFSSAEERHAKLIFYLFIFFDNQANCKIRLHWPMKLLSGSFTFTWLSSDLTVDFYPDLLSNINSWALSRKQGPYCHPMMTNKGRWDSLVRIRIACLKKMTKKVDKHGLVQETLSAVTQWWSWPVDTHLQLPCPDCNLLGLV